MEYEYKTGVSLPAIVTKINKRFIRDEIIKLLESKGCDTSTVYIDYERAYAFNPKNPSSKAWDSVRPYNS